MRKLFGTDGVRGIANKYPLDPETIVKLGRAIGYYFKKHRNKNNHLNGSPIRVVVGKDTRISGYMIETAIISGLCSAGVHALLVGPMPTPSIAHLVRSFAADGGIMISASHNPAEDNGIKVFDSNGFKLSDEAEEEIEGLMNALEDKRIDSEIIGGLIGKAKRIEDARGRYIEFAKSSINNKSLKGLRVVVDCANGAAYAVTPLILRELGADVIVLNNKPNGLNINKNCGALHPELIQKVVVEEKADVGIALDGDADRVVMVDEKGNIVDGDHILLMSAIALKEEGRLKNNTVVATVMSNIGLEIALKKLGINLVRTKVGDRYVLEEMRKSDYNLGGEQSGHIIFLDYSTTGDGTIASLQVLKIMKEKQRKLSELASLLDKKPQVLLNQEVKQKIPLEQLSILPKKILEVKQRLGNNGRVLVRYSGTQNVLRIMVEGPDEELLWKLAREIAQVAEEELRN